MENKTLTAAERAALAEAREAEAQRAKRTQNAPAKPIQKPIQKPTAPKQSAQRPPQAQVPKSTNKNNTREYPRVTGAKPPIRAAAPQAKESDTGEFPSYVRRGKGGYHPQKVKARRITKHRKPLDSRVKAGIAAVGAILAIWILLLLFGVRYTTAKMADGGEVRFFGTVKDGVPQSGWISTSDGERGRLKNTKTIHFANGDVYEGDLVDGKRAGQGKYTFANGDEYVGSFLENEMHGHGILTYANGDSYEGDFAYGKREGNGRIAYADGSTYEGKFQEDRKHGYGEYVKDNTYYKGEFVADLKEGKGEQRFANGDSYVGEYRADMRNGEGKYTWANGESYEGTFRDNQMHGEGVFTWPSGRTDIGRFENGQIVNE